MSNYAHLCCIPCREALFVKDSDSDAHASPRELGQFLEKHHRHHLEFLHENDGVGDYRLFEFPSDDWPRFKLPETGSWSHGVLYP